MHLYLHFCSFNLNFRYMDSHTQTDRHTHAYMYIGICLHIMCLMLSMWKVRSDDIAKRGRDDAVLASISFMGQRAN